MKIFKDLQQTLLTLLLCLKLKNNIKLCMKTMLNFTGKLNNCQH